MRHPVRSLLALLAVPLLAAGCEDATTTPPPPPTGGTPLVPGVWYLHSIDGEDLPAMASERIVGVAQEQVFVDSGRVVVYSNGTYEQRYWTRILVSTTLDRAETVIDLGTWNTSGGQHNFTSNVRVRQFSWFTPTLSLVNSVERFATHVSAEENDAVYRLTRP